MSVLAVSGSAMLLGVSSSLQNAQEATERTIATGLAEQMVDEVLGARYASPGVSPYQWPLGPNATELAGAGRSRFDDSDDFHGFAAKAPQEPGGATLGTGDGGTGQRAATFRVPSDYFDGWKQEFEVYYVDEDDPRQRLSGSNTSHLRAVEARVLREVTPGVWRTLVTVRRVFAYVPAPND